MNKYIIKSIIKKNFLITLFLIILTIFCSSIFLMSLSTKHNLKKSYYDYNDKYGQYDLLIETQYSDMNDYKEFNKIYGIDKIYHRLCFDVVSRIENKTYSSKIHTYNDESFESFYVIEKEDNYTNIPSIKLENKFAAANNIKAGDFIDVGIADIYETCFVESIITNPETLHFGNQKGLWISPADNAYIYIYKDDFKILLDHLVGKIEEKRNNDPEFKKNFDSILGSDIKYYNLIKNGNFDYNDYYNQVLIILNDTYHNDVDHFVEVSGIKNISSINNINTKDTSSSYSYMTRVMESVDIVAVTFSIMFYLLMLVISSLFIAHIIKVMKKKFASMLSMGLSRQKLTKILIIYVLLISLIGLIIGIIVAIFLNRYLTKVCVTNYNLHEMSNHLYFLVLIICIILTILIYLISILITMKRIYKISIVETLTGERNEMPKKLKRRNENISSTKALVTTFFYQGFSKHFINFVSYFASIVLIIVTFTFYISQKNVLKQIVVDRMNYDFEVFTPDYNIENLENKINEENNITTYHLTLFNQMELKKNDKIVTTRIEGISVDDDIYIPSKNGRKRIEFKTELNNEIILDKKTADTLGVKVGNTVTINNKEFKIRAISYQYMNIASYISKKDFKLLNDDYYGRLICKANNINQAVNKISDNSFNSLILKKETADKNLRNSFEIYDVFTYVLISFAAIISLSIILMINSSSLIDKQKTFATLRSLGSNLKKIRTIWTLESLFELIPALIFGYIVGLIIEKYFLIAVTGKGQAYPFVDYLYPYLIILSFILLIYLFTTFVVFRNIKKLKLQELIKSRE